MDMSPAERIGLATSINSFKDTPYVSAGYEKMVPDLVFDQQGNVANFDNFSNIMMQYEKLQNEYISSMINKIGLTLIEKVSGSNPLAMFKKNALVKGVDVEMIFTNPAVAQDIGVVNDANMQKSFKTYKPDTKVAYLRVNRGADGMGEIYPVTIPQQDLKRAFQSFENMGDFIVSLVRSLTAGDEIDEFKYTKKIVDNAVASNLVRTVVIDADVESEANLKKFISKVKSSALNMTIPSASNNAYTNFPDSFGNPATVVSDADDLCLIIRSDVMANIDVAVLASAFNIPYRAIYCIYSFYKLVLTSS